MPVMNYMEVFIEIYNVIAALIIIFLIGQILFMMRKVDMDLFKARLFLNEAILRNTWMFISIAGASFALNSLIKFITILAQKGEILRTFYTIELTQVIFLISFILAIYNWYVFIGGFVRSE